MFTRVVGFKKSKFNGLEAPQVIADGEQKDPRSVNSKSLESSPPIPPAPHQILISWVRSPEKVRDRVDFFSFFLGCQIYRGSFLGLDQDGYSHL